MQNSFLTENFTKEPDIISPWIDKLLTPVSNIGKSGIIKKIGAKENGEVSAIKPNSNVISLNNSKLSQALSYENIENDDEGEYSDEGAEAEEGGARIYTYPVKKILTPCSDIYTDADIGSGINKNTFRKLSVDNELEKEITYLSFNVNNSYLSFSVDNIIEIIRYTEPFKLYTKKIELLGLINYRGSAIPIYDFFAVNSYYSSSSYVYGCNDGSEALFGKGKNGRFKYIAICSFNKENFGLCIDNAGTIKKIKNKELMTPNIIKYKNSKNLTYKLFENEDGKFSSIIEMQNLYNYLKS
ncbi:MAG: chemotaxis protein CheW [Candidatus Acididesulfobacter guangdongensis]|uniref:Chemotaxis protein CheW n=1 Tax=Acididesulfobacter guangdongensis TaxID=2597225 RepID=A0A519BFZ8_ACIG2|nr:MAG: chemotaxis protein CheW [Candidatus Acididesulfobacter guangdongensis]